MNSTRILLVLLVLFVFVLAGGCSSPAATLAPDVAEVSGSYWPDEGWRRSTPEHVGMDSAILADMLKTIREQGHHVDSVTVIRNGFMVLDTTVYPFRPDRKHVINSCTKSIVSILIGIAIDEGYIEGVDQPVSSFFPQRKATSGGAEKEDLTLEHLLTMTSGLECRDSYLYRWRGMDEMRASQDWVQYVLDLPMEAEPGTKFEYCNGASFLLSAIIEEATGKNALEFAEEHLFGPLGISGVDWPANHQGIAIGWGGIRMKPHDMAKIGYLYSRGGEWDGEQIVPSWWVEASTEKHTPATLEDGYGYQWWVDDSGIYMALGYAGQFIFVIPEKDLVAVFTSDLSESDFYVPQNLLNEFIIPAVKSATSIAENPEGFGMLESVVEDLASP